MNGAAEIAWIVDRAKELGFALCGVVRFEQFPEHESIQTWLNRGYAGEMAYLSDGRRQDPARVLAGARSAIVCALNYNTPHPYSTEIAAGKEEGPRGWISRYAWGSDYHKVLWERLNALAAGLRERFPEEHRSRAYADTGPVAERIFAKHAGLGWLGKNTLLLNEELGSWFFLGVIVTTLELAPSLGTAEIPPADLCGHCRQCLDACPTEALVEPYVLDARKCISYLTIELRGSIPEELRAPIGRHVYGCDICQDVCPYNRVAPVTDVKEFEPRSWKDGTSLLQPELEWLAGMTEQEFREKFRGSAMKRTKWRGLVRNACVALGNAKVEKGSEAHGRIVNLLKRLEGAEDEGMAESAHWALGRIQ
jgi:epoxyqueuosine reductase